MAETCTLVVDGKEYVLPVIEGSEGEKAIDISKLRAQTGYITIDSGFANTGSCESSISFIDGDAGILRYRGIPIEVLAEKSSFIETAYLVIFGHLPSQAERTRFTQLLTESSALHTSMEKHFDGFPPNAHPMAIMSAMINALSMHDRPKISDPDTLEVAAAKLMSKVRTIAAASYKSSIGEPLIYPRYDANYVENFLHMMFSLPYAPYEPTPQVVKALNMFLVLHADHEQNCSTSTVRMVASSEANLYASCAAGVCALWGPLHGGANQQVIYMLENIYKSGMEIKDFMAKVKDKKSNIRLMGFGHRVYKNFDPRARILKKTCDELLDSLHMSDPLLDIARELEGIALEDDYFKERRLYPNVDFYSGIILRAIGIPVNMFTVMFAIGRTPGWIANWKEVNQNPNGRIARPRQIYTGPGLNDWIPRAER